MARHRRMPSLEAGYTYAVEPTRQRTACLQTRRSPYTDALIYKKPIKINKMVGPEGLDGAAFRIRPADYEE